MIGNFIRYFMSGQILIDFGSWIWNDMLIGWSKGLWEWHQRVSEVPWPLYIDTIFSFCVALFLIACIWFLLSIIFASLWVGLAFCWIIAWFVWLIILITKWFVVELLGTILAWIWPICLSFLVWLWSAIAFFFKWLVILFVPGVIAAATLIATYELPVNTNKVSYVWTWIAITACVAIVPFNWFVWHYAITLLCFFGMEYKPSKTSP